MNTPMMNPPALPPGYSLTIDERGNVRLRYYHNDQPPRDMWITSAVELDATEHLCHSYRTLHRPPTITSNESPTELLTKCAVDHPHCQSGPLADWFSIHMLINQDAVFYFCPRHALAAEVLAGIGITVEYMARLIRDTENGIT